MAVGGYRPLGNVGGALNLDDDSIYSYTHGDNPDATAGASLMAARLQDSRTGQVSGNNMWLPFLQRLQGTKVEFPVAKIPPSLQGLQTAASPISPDQSQDLGRAATPEEVHYFAQYPNEAAAYKKKYGVR